MSDADTYLAARAAEECEIALLLGPQIADYMTLSAETLAFGVSLLPQESALVARSEASLVIARLLIRLLDDLRVCQVVAQRGYVLQALTIASGMIELASAAGFIGADENRARAWLSHADPRRTYPPDLRDAIRATAEMLGGDKGDADNVYAQYRDLCMAKHSNPIALSQTGVEIDGDLVHLHVGPQRLPSAVWPTRRALAHAIRQTLTTTFVFVKHHAPADVQIVAKPRLFDLGQRIISLSAGDAEQAGRSSALGHGER